MQCLGMGWDGYVIVYAACMAKVPAFKRESRCLMVCANVYAEF